MAQRRMFSMRITDSDLFTEMPLSSQCLYFHLAMHADDDGFVNGVKRIRRMIGASEDDLKLLLTKGFVIPFETGVCVIRHWRIHNYIQKDRYTPTIYKDERATLEIKDGVYTEHPQQLPDSLSTGCTQDVSKMDTYPTDEENPEILGVNGDVSKMDTSCIQDVSRPDTQVRLGIGTGIGLESGIGQVKGTSYQKEKKYSNYNNNWRTSARARMATAQVVVNHIQEEHYPIDDRELYDKILDAMDKGVAPYDIERIARTADTSTFDDELRNLIRQRRYLDSVRANLQARHREFVAAQHGEEE